MSERSASTWRVYRSDDERPAAAEAMFGHEVTQLAEDFAAGEATREPVCLAALDEQGDWRAAALMLLEPGAHETVMSIRQLVVPPAERGKGLGGGLIRRAMQTARDLGASRVRSTAGWGCPDHLAMYDRMRFDRLNASQLPYLVSRSVQA